MINLQRIEVEKKITFFTVLILEHIDWQKLCVIGV